MTTTRSAMAASLSATTLALLLQQPVLADDTPTAAASAEPQPAQETTAPAQHPAEAALAAFEKRRAAHMAELDKRYEELRADAEKHGFEMPPTAPWTNGPQWLSYEEMQALMKAQGVELPKAPSLSAGPTQPPMPVPPTGAASPQEQKQIFETFEQMTPEQQEACFALSRWQAPRMPRRMPPAYSRQPLSPYPPAYAPRHGQPFPGMMRPQ